MPDDILDRLTWREVGELAEYWEDYPPLQRMVQGYLGIKPKYRPAPSGDFTKFVEELNRN